MTKATDGKLEPGELKPISPEAKAPPKPATGADPKKPANTAQAATTPTRQTGAADTAGTPPKPEAKPAPPKLASAPHTPTAPKSALPAVKTQRVPHCARLLASILEETNAADVEWSARWSASLYGADEEMLIDFHQQHRDALRSLDRLQKEIRAHMGSLHKFRRHATLEDKAMSELIDRVPAAAYTGQEIKSKADAQRVLTEIRELVAEFEADDAAARARVREAVDAAADPAALLAATQTACDELEVLGFKYGPIVEHFADMNAMLRRIDRHHQKQHAGAAKATA